MNELIGDNKFIVSLLLIAISLIVRWIVVRHLRKLSWDENDLPRRWINSAKNAINLLIVIGLIIIWLSELRFVALSIATFIVALVIATREFIQCLMGSLYQASTRTFTIGDWIKVGAHYGEVGHSDWLSTTLLEIDMETMSYAYTGRTLVIPNNQFVANPIQNLNFMRRYVAHSFSIVREAEPVNPFDAKEFILEKAKEYSLPFSDVAQRYNGVIEKRMGVSITGPEASVRITTNNLGKNVFTVTVFCPTKDAVGIEQQLTEDFLDFWYRELALYKAKHGEGGKINSPLTYAT